MEPESPVQRTASIIRRSSAFSDVIYESSDDNTPRYSREVELFSRPRPWSVGPVIEFLLSREYLLTAFELLQELDANPADGDEEPIAALRSFFENPQLFPPEALRLHQTAEAPSLAALARGREERLSAVEYELRLAAEDAADARDALAAAQAQAAGGAVGGAGASSSAAAAGRDHAALVEANVALKARITALEADLAATTARARHAETAAATAVTVRAANASLPAHLRDKLGGGDRRASVASPPVGTPAVNGSFTHVPSPLGVSSGGGAAAQAAAAAATAAATSLVRTLADALPRLLPSVLVDKRAALLPVYLAAARVHPDATARDALLHALFNLVKRPDASQREDIATGVAALAAAAGEARSEEELLPQCWEQISHAAPERRALAAAVTGRLAPHVRSDLRGSLVLSILQQLAGDAAPAVRSAAVQGLGRAVSALSGDGSYPAVAELYFKFAGDADEDVAAEAASSLLPAITAWLTAGESTHLIGGLLPQLLSKLAEAVAACPPSKPELMSDDLDGASPAGDGAAESPTPAGPRAPLGPAAAKAAHLARMLATLMPAVRGQAGRTHPDGPPHNDDDANARWVAHGVAVAAAEAGGDATPAPPSWPAAEWALGGGAAALAAILQSVAPPPGAAGPATPHPADVMTAPPPWAATDGLRMALCAAVAALAACVGPTATDVTLLPLYLAAAGAPGGGTTASCHRLVPSHVPTARAAVLPHVLAGLLPASGAPGGVTRYLRAVITGEDGLPPATAGVALRFLAQHRPEALPAVIASLREHMASPSAGVRTALACLVASAVPGFDEPQALAHAAPVLVALSLDGDAGVTVAAVSGLASLAVCFPGDDAVGLVQSQLEALVERLSNPLYEAGGAEVAATGHRPLWSPPALAVVAAVSHAGAASKSHRAWACAQLLALVKAAAASGGAAARRRPLASALASAYPRLVTAVCGDASTALAAAVGTGSSTLGAVPPPDLAIGIASLWDDDTRSRVTGGGGVGRSASTGGLGGSVTGGSAPGSGNGVPPTPGGSSAAPVASPANATDAAPTISRGDDALPGLMSPSSGGVTSLLTTDERATLETLTAALAASVAAAAAPPAAKPPPSAASAFAASMTPTLASWGLASASPVAPAIPGVAPLLTATSATKAPLPPGAGAAGAAGLIPPVPGGGGGGGGVPRSTLPPRRGSLDMTEATPAPVAPHVGPIAAVTPPAVPPAAAAAWVAQAAAADTIKRPPPAAVVATSTRAVMATAASDARHAAESAITGVELGAAAAVGFFKTAFTARAPKPAAHAASAAQIPATAVIAPPIGPLPVSVLDGTLPVPVPVTSAVTEAPASETVADSPDWAGLASGATSPNGRQSLDAWMPDNK